LALEFAAHALVKRGSTMVAFELSVNGQRRFIGDAVTAITLVSELAGRRQADRVSMHVGTGGPGDREVHRLAADLKPGDEVVIRVLGEEEIHRNAFPSPEACSFCGVPDVLVQSLLVSGRTAVCDVCLASLSDTVVRGAALPLGASIRSDAGGMTCGICGKTPPEVPALLARNGSAICPECLRSCVELVGRLGRL
jgi:hypothetical protein